MSSKIVILGGSGYIGRELSKFLQLSDPLADLVVLGSKDIDLTTRAAANDLDDILDEHTTLYICAGIKKQLGDNLENFKRNLEITQSIVASKKVTQCKKTIFLSSAEVYGENINSLSISEKSPCMPSSYYGLAKKTSEDLFDLVYQKSGARGLVVVRMPLVYGPRESQNIYGPSGFFANAKAGKVQTLWGDGSEKRNFLFIDDLIQALSCMGNSDFEGLINIANSRSNSFKDVIDTLENLRLNLSINQKARSKEKVNQGYDISLLKKTFQNFKPHSLEQGLSKMLSTEGGR